MSREHCLPTSHEPRRNAGRRKPARKGGRFLPTLELLENRELLSGDGFLQGTVFDDASQDQHFDPGEAPLAGATVTLLQQTAPDTFTALGAPVVTGSDGGFLFSGLDAGTYRLVQTPPSGYMAAGIDLSSPLYAPSAVGTGGNTIQVTIPADSQLQVYLDGDAYYNGGNQPRSWEALSYDFYGVTKNDLVGRYQVTVSGPALAQPTTLKTFCVDLAPGHSFGLGNNTFTAVPRPGLDAGAPNAPHDFGRIAYLYNRFGQGALTSVQAAALQFAIWEVEYDTGDDVTSGNVKLLGPLTTWTTQDTFDAVKSQAQFYLSDSAGKSDRAMMLNATGTPTSGGMQGLIAPGVLNFADAPGGTNTLTGQLSGTKFNDVNGNGTRDSGEPGLQGWTIQLFNGSNPLPVATTTTASDGSYSFTGLTLGSYRVREVNQTGWVQTTANPADVMVLGATTVCGLDFGNFQLGLITGAKFNDVNGDGARQAGEPGLQGWTIQLMNTSNSVLQTTTTGADGSYSFAGLTAGPYRVREVGQTGWVQTTVNPGDVTVLSGTAVDAVFGNFKKLSISGHKFEDKNADGLWDKDGLDNVSGTADDEKGLSGWTIKLYTVDANGQLTDTGKSMVTVVDGSFSFADLGPLPAGSSYTAQEVQQNGWLLTTQDQVVAALSGQDACDRDIGNYHGSLVMAGDTATIGFWHNKNGQAIIKGFGKTADGRTLANWLATEFPALYGSQAGAANDLTGKSNTDVANYFMTLFNVTGQKVRAQILGSAFAVFTTSSSLNTTAAGQKLATKYGFTVNNLGVGADLYNIGSNGAAFGVADNTLMTVMQILKATNDRVVNTQLYGGDQTLINMANIVYSGINQSGDIG